MKRKYQVSQIGFSGPEVDMMGDQCGVLLTPVEADSGSEVRDFEVRGGNSEAYMVRRTVDELRILVPRKSDWPQFTLGRIFTVEITPE